MWIVAKIKSKEINSFMSNLREKTCKKLQFYNPKILLEKEKCNKSKNYEKPVIDGYIFCFHPIFSSKDIINNLRNLKGLNYFLTNYNILDQKNILSFINYCKKFENEKGFLSPNFFDCILKDRGKFISGPFKNLVFDIIKKNKKNLRIKIGNFATTVKRNSYLFRPI